MKNSILQGRLTEFKMTSSVSFFFLFYQNSIKKVARFFKIQDFPILIDVFCNFTVGLMMNCAIVRTHSFTFSNVRVQKRRRFFEH